MNLIKLSLQVFKSWLPLAVAITFIFGAIYAVVQQNYRQNANDPQIQIAEDIANSLDAGAEALSIIPSSYSIDISRTLSPFAIVYDDNSKAIASSAQLDGKTPEVPAGVFDFVKSHGEERLTWEPKDDVRIAAVVKKYSKGYVLAGRSLREVEIRERRLELMLGVAWIFTMGATFITVAALEFIYTTFKKKK